MDGAVDAEPNGLVDVAVGPKGLVVKGIVESDGGFELVGKGEPKGKFELVGRNGFVELVGKNGLAGDAAKGLFGMDGDPT